MLKLYKESFELLDEAERAKMVNNFSVNQIVKSQARISALKSFSTSKESQLDSG